MLWNRSFTDLPKCLIRTREVCSAASERRGIWTLCEAAREGADGIACINTIADVTYSIWHNLTYIHLSLISPLSLQFWCLLEHLNVIFWQILWPFVQHCRSWNTKYIEQATWVTHGCQTEYICLLYTVYLHATLYVLETAFGHLILSIKRLCYEMMKMLLLKTFFEVSPAHGCSYTFISLDGRLRLSLKFAWTEPQQAATLLWFRLLVVVIHWLK